MGNVLWLVSWYPNRMDAFDGDFIERHAKATSRYEKITVLLVVKDESLKRNTVEIEKTEDENLVVYKVYYGKSGWGGIFEKFFSFRKYISLQKKLYKQIIKQEGIPGILHVQVAMKAGMLARWIKRKYHIPYIVTEHWTGYYPQSIPNIYSGNIIFKNLNRKVLAESAMFLPVSDDLGKIVNKHFIKIPYKVVPNTVDTTLFYRKPPTTKPFRFIHPSNMSYQKNPDGILEACKIVLECGYVFELLMIGNKSEWLDSLSFNYGLSKIVLIEGTVPYTEVAKQMQQSMALLLFSRFENLPCVVIEALCCGLPVISSRVGGIPEAVGGENGILVESENVAALAGAMMQMMDNYTAYDRTKIAANAGELFNYDRVGRQYAEIYKNIRDLQ